MPDEPEVQGLLALMLLTDARRASRFAGGALVALPDQDRSRWDRDLIAEGHDIVRGCLRRGRPGRYQILAAVNAVHTDAASVEQTDWRQIVMLYDQLFAVDPTPVVALNRAIAVAEVDGPEAALDDPRHARHPGVPRLPGRPGGSAAPSRTHGRSAARPTSVPSSWPVTPPSGRSSAAGSTISAVRAPESDDDWWCPVGAVPELAQARIGASDMRHHQFWGVRDPLDRALRNQLISMEPEVHLNGG